MCDQLYKADGSVATPNGTNDKGKPGIYSPKPCFRCGGAGGADTWKFTGWYCYECGGNRFTGQQFERLYTEKELATKNKRAATVRAKREAKEAAAEASRVAAVAEREEMLKGDAFFQRLKAEAGDNEFLNSVLHSYRAKDISERQREAVQKFFDKRDAAKERVEASRWVDAAIGDRVEVVGVVTGSRCVYYAAGYWEKSRFAVTIEGNGVVFVWFTTTDYKKGAEFAGTATLKDKTEFHGLKQNVVKNYRAKKGKSK